MKIKGQKIEGPNEVLVVIPRGESGIGFKCRAVLDYTNFDKLCPEIQPKQICLAGQTQFVPNVTEPTYIKAVAERDQARMDWMIKESLKATEDLEWETVVESDASTWKNIQDEMQDSGFSMMEIGRIVGGVLEANCLSQDKLDKARSSFLALEAAQLDALSSQPAVAEVLNTQSGEPAKDLESDQTE